MCVGLVQAAPASAGLGQGLEGLHFQKAPPPPMLPAAGLKLLASVQLLAAFSPGQKDRFSSSLLLTTRLTGQAMACAWTPSHHVSSSSQPHRLGFSQNTSSFIIFTPSQSSNEPAMTPLRRQSSFIITPTLQMKKQRRREVDWPKAARFLRGGWVDVNATGCPRSTAKSYLVFKTQLQCLTFLRWLPRPSNGKNTPFSFLMFVLHVSFCRVLLGL